MSPIAATRRITDVLRLVGQKTGRQALAAKRCRAQNRAGLVTVNGRGVHSGTMALGGWFGGLVTLQIWLVVLLKALKRSRNAYDSFAEIDAVIRTNQRRDLRTTFLIRSGACKPLQKGNCRKSF